MVARKGWIPYTLLLVGCSALAAFLVVSVSRPQFVGLELLGSGAQQGDMQYGTSTLDRLLDGPGIEAAKYGEQAKKYRQEADKETAIISKARNDQQSAENLVNHLRQQLRQLTTSMLDVDRNDADSSPTPRSPTSLASEDTDEDGQPSNLQAPASLFRSNFQGILPAVQTDNLDGWKIRRTLHAARVASRRANEAKVIEQNELAVADAQAKLVAELEAQQEKARRNGAKVEDVARASSFNHQKAKDDLFHSALNRYTNQLQNFVDDDMNTLGQLKRAEESAAFGPRTSASGVWTAPPYPSTLPDVDATTFMGNAPFRSESDLANYKSVGRAQQLAQTSGAQVQQRAIDRVMDEEKDQLARLMDMTAPAAAAPKSDDFNSQPASAAPSHQQFTSFVPQTASLSAAAKEDAQDGQLIRDAGRPVALVRIPLGAKEDAHRRGARPVTAPEQTVEDHSPGSWAVRADGTHHDQGAGDVSMLEVHMPHVQ